MFLCNYFRKHLQNLRDVYDSVQPLDRFQQIFILNNFKLFKIEDNLRKYKLSPTLLIVQLLMYFVLVALVVFENYTSLTDDSLMKQSFVVYVNYGDDSQTALATVLNLTFGLINIKMISDILNNINDVDAGFKKVQVTICHSYVLISCVKRNFSFMYYFVGGFGVKVVV